MGVCGHEMVVAWTDEIDIAVEVCAAAGVHTVAEVEPASCMIAEEPSAKMVEPWKLAAAAGAAVVIAEGQKTWETKHIAGKSIRLTAAVEAVADDKNQKVGFGYSLLVVPKQAADMSRSWTMAPDSVADYAMEGDHIR